MKYVENDGVKGMCKTFKIDVSLLGIDGFADKTRARLKISGTNPQS